MGSFSGSPYTVAEEEKKIFMNPLGLGIEGGREGGCVSIGVGGACMHWSFE